MFAPYISFDPRCSFHGLSINSISAFSLRFSYSLTFSPQVLEFQKGTLQNLFWKKFGCGSCTGDLFVCLNNTDCAIPNSKCKNNGGTIGCDIGIQLAFSGTDKNDAVLNSWYEVANLRQYSLYALYSGIRDSITSPFTNLFWDFKVYYLYSLTRKLSIHLCMKLTIQLEGEKYVWVVKENVEILGRKTYIVYWN